MDNQILVIGIAGGTGSGKTTLMKNIMTRFEGHVTVLSHDNYYRRNDHLTYEERCQINYDEPAALETDLMATPEVWATYRTPMNSHIKTFTKMGILLSSPVASARVLR